MEAASHATRTLSIGTVTGTNGAQIVAGTVTGNIYFGGSREHVATSAVTDKANDSRNALFLTDPAIDRASLISTKGKRVTGTWDWILEQDSYRSWRHNDTPLLWIWGGPGKGKTMLSIFLSQELERSTETVDDAHVIFYFCINEDKNRNNAAAILRGLLWQITMKRPGLMRHLVPYFETSEKTNMTLSSPETLWSIFTKLLDDPDVGKVFCVLDGLDECDAESISWLVTKIIDFTSTSEESRSKTNALSVAIISRNVPGLKSVVQVRLDPDNDEQIGNDIRKFISVRVQELSGVVGFTREFQQAVEDALLERAEGTFLWVGLAMAELRKKTTCTEIENTIRSLPKGLSAIYSRMLLQIEPKNRIISSRILRWIAMAVRPLTLQELAAAIYTRSSSLVSIKQAIEDQIAMCGPFVKVHENQIGLVH